MPAYTSSRLPLENTPRGIRPIHRVTRSLAVVAAALGLILGSAPSAHASIVNMDVDGDGLDYTGPGLLGTPGMTWNYQASAANGTYTGFLDSTGSNSSVTMTLTGMSLGTNLGGVAPVGFDALYTGYLYFGNASVVLNGLDPNLTYDVVFFSGFSNNNNGTLNRHYGAEITHTATTTMLRSYGNLGTGGATTLSEGQNYVHFKNLSPISGSLTFTMKTNTVADTNISGFTLGGAGVVNGFQLVAVPEPAIMGLLCLGGLVLAARRRRAA